MALSATPGRAPPSVEGAPSLAASPRLAAYVGVGAAALVASLVTARPALAAFGAPLLLLAVVGVCLARRPELTIHAARITPGQAIVGDVLAVELELEARPPPGRLDVAVAMAGPVEVVGAPAGPRSSGAAWTIGQPRTEPCRTELATVDWGRVTVSRATVRAHGPLALVHWTWTVPLMASARVLPRPERLRTLLDPPPRAAAGSHASTARGGGLDFAELRPLAPGDRLADVNWRASARRGQIGGGRLLVNVRHPERTGDVVLLLDTSADDEEERAPWLPRAARAAWAIAQAHLKTHDRVGLVSFGGYTSWVTIGGGERAAYALLDKLLAVRPTTGGAHRSLTWLPSRLLPADAAVVAVTPLHTLLAVDALVDLRRHGRRVAAVIVDSMDLLPDDRDLDVAKRFWGLELDRRVELLARAGVITTRWRADSTLAAAVTLLARMARPSAAAVVHQ